MRDVRVLSGDVAIIGYMIRIQRLFCVSSIWTALILDEWINILLNNILKVSLHNITAIR